MQAAEIQREMQQVRTNLGTDVRNLAQQARDTTDWRYYVRRYPWICLGAVAAAGFLLVPKKRSQSTADASQNGHASAAATASGAGLASAITAMAVRAIASAVVQVGIDFMKRRKTSASVETEQTEAGPAVPRGRGDIEQTSGAEPW